MSCTGSIPVLLNADQRSGIERTTEPPSTQAQRRDATKIALRPATIRKPKRPDVRRPKLCGDCCAHPAINLCQICGARCCDRCYALRRWTTACMGPLPTYMACGGCLYNAIRCYQAALLGHASIAVGRPADPHVDGASLRIGTTGGSDAP